MKSQIYPPQQNKDLSVCFNCGYRSLSWSKYLQCGLIAGWSFHYKVFCTTCRKSRYVEHHPYPEKITKAQEWKLSKETRKHIISMMANHVLPIIDLPFEVDLSKILFTIKPIIVSQQEVT